MNNPAFKGGISAKSLGKISRAYGIPIPKNVSDAVISQDGTPAPPPRTELTPPIDAAAVSYELDIQGETYISVPAFDARVSSGAAFDGASVLTERVLFRQSWIRRYTSAPIRDLAVIEIANDCMAPLLQVGDSALIDRSQRSPGAQDGYYALRRDGGLQVKRLRTSYRSRAVDVVNENPAYSPDLAMPLHELDICGRVLWIGRRI